LKKSGRGKDNVLKVTFREQDLRSKYSTAQYSN